MIPVRVKDPMAAIGNYWATPHLATADEVELLQALANTTAVALESVRLYAELEQRVRERTQQLQEANSELEAFSYSVSHDLRTPLNQITGFSNLLLEQFGSDLSDKARHYLERTIEGSHRMAQLIADLLRLAKFTQAPLEYARVNLTTIAQPIIARLKSEAPDRQAEFRVEADLEVRADLGLFQVVMENLLSNAWKYTAKKPRAVIEIGCLGAAEGGAYFVRDNGAGFDMQYAAKLFASFQRLHSQNDFVGHGVGLATVRRIIGRHGGRIWAEAEPDKGATFFFTVGVPPS